MEAQPPQLPAAQQMREDQAVHQLSEEVSEGVDIWALRNQRHVQLLQCWQPEVPLALFGDQGCSDGEVRGVRSSGGGVASAAAEASRTAAELTAPGSAGPLGLLLPRGASLSALGQQL